MTWNKYTDPNGNEQITKTDDENRVWFVSKDINDSLYQQYLKHIEENNNG